MNLAAFSEMPRSWVICLVMMRAAIQNELFMCLSLSRRRFSFLRCNGLCDGRTLCPDLGRRSPPFGGPDWQMPGDAERLLRE